MAKTMSEILEIHSLSDSGGDVRCYHGGKFDCWEASDDDSNAYSAFANHQADMLKADGYGLMSTAWDEGRASFPFDLRRNSFWQPVTEVTKNPYLRGKD